MLGTSKWEFYVFPTEQINYELGNQKRVGSNRISV